MFRKEQQVGKESVSNPVYVECLDENNSWTKICLRFICKSRKYFKKERNVFYGRIYKIMGYGEIHGKISRIFKFRVL